LCLAYWFQKFKRRIVCYSTALNYIYTCGKSALDRIINSYTQKIVDNAQIIVRRLKDITRDMNSLRCHLGVHLNSCCPYPQKNSTFHCTDFTQYQGASLTVLEQILSEPRELQCLPSNLENLRWSLIDQEPCHYGNKCYPFFHNQYTGAIILIFS